MATKTYTTDLTTTLDPNMYNASWLKCSLEDEQQLVLQAQAGDDIARDLLFRACINAARRHVSINNSRSPYFRELFGVAEEAVYEAIARHDVTRGARLITYVVWTVRRKLWEARKDVDVRYRISQQAHYYNKANPDNPMPDYCPLYLDAPISDVSTNDNVNISDKIGDKAAEKGLEDDEQAEWASTSLQYLMDLAGLSNDKRELLKQYLATLDVGTKDYMILHAADLAKRLGTTTAIARSRLTSVLDGIRLCAGYHSIKSFADVQNI